MSGAKTKKTEVRTVMSETARWVVDESDGTRFLLRRLGSGRTVLVDHDGVGWVCSEDGPQPGRKRQAQATGQCPHIQLAARSLPVSLATTLAAKIASPHAKRGTPIPDGVEKVEKTQRRTGADILAAATDLRAERAQEHDEAFVAATPVVVRQMTQADRLKLDAARARKARSFEEPERPRRFAG